MKNHLISCFFIIFFGMSSCLAAHAAENYVFKDMWPVLEQDWYFGYPNHVATDKDNNVYVADYGVLKYSPAGELLNSWGSRATGTDKLKQIGGIDVDAEGNVYMTDYANHLVQVSSPAGDILAGWGTYGDEIWEFDTPEGILVDGQGRIIVADTGNARLQVFNSLGGLIKFINSETLGIGTFKSPDYMALDSAGFLYVTDPPNIHIFDSNLEYIQTVSIPFSIYSNIAIGSDNSIYLASNEAVYRCSFDGQTLTVVDSITEGIENPFSIAVDADGIVYVSMQPSAFIFHGKEMRVCSYSPDGELLTVWKSSGSGPGQFLFPADIALAPDGSVYVADTYNHRIQQFSATGEFIRAWGELGDGPGQFDTPENVAVDGAGNVYTRQQSNLYRGFRLQKFNAAGEFLAELTTDAFVAEVNSMDVDSSGNIFLTDKSTESLLKLDPTGQQIGSFNGPDSQTAISYYPTAVAVGPDDSIYLGYALWVREGDQIIGLARVQHLNADLVLLNSWTCEPLDGKTGTHILDLAIDVQGNVFVTEGSSCAIRKYSAQGEFLGVWGGTGAGPGQFRCNNGLALAPTGELYVADQVNSRIQVLEPVDIPGGAYTGWWWEGPEKPGTGVSIEVQGSSVYLAWYGYELSGQPVWYSAKLEKSGLSYRGELYSYSGWPLAGNDPSAGYSGQSLGEASLEFSSTSEATLIFKKDGWEYGKRLSRFWDGDLDSRPLHGWWHDPAFPGMGLFMEARGGNLFASWFHYGDEGGPCWWITMGDFGASDSAYSGLWLEYAGGQTITGNYAAPGAPSDKGAAGLTLLENGNIRMDWNGRSFTMQPFDFDE